MLRRRLLLNNLAAFSPMDLGNGIGWFDASDISTLSQDTAGVTGVAANGDPVGRWMDKSGIGNHVTQATGTAKPTYATGIQNGKAGLSYDGGDFLDSVATYPSFPLTIFAVVKTPGTVSLTKGIVSLLHSTSFGSRLNFLNTNVITARIETPTAARVSAATFGINTSIVTGARFNAIESAVLTNGTIVSGSHIASAVTNIFRVAGLQVNSASSAWIGHIFEVIIYNTALSDAQMGQLSLYLNQKWGVY